MSLHLASDFLTTPAEIARTPALTGVATRLIALVRRLRPTGLALAMTRSERLSAADLRDMGLRADQIGQAPIWGHGGIMWRP
jgi:hypothetical protein